MESSGTETVKNENGGAIRPGNDYNLEHCDQLCCSFVEIIMINAKIN